MSGIIGRVRRSERITISLILAAAVGWVFLMSSLSAGAAPAPGTIEQHHELLAEKITGQVGSGSVTIERGVLPGSTTKFDPQPTATLEVVAKVGAAVGSGDGYNVELKDASGSNPPLASVAFRKVDSAFSLKTAALSWPAADTALSKLAFTAVGTGPGTLDVQKAYVKIHQTGLVAKTVGRVPIVSKATNITSSAFVKPADLAYYTHRSTDFDPAPTIRLRVTALATLCSIEVQLVDGAGLAVAGSTLSFGNSDPSSLESSPLILRDPPADGTPERYHLEARATTAGCIQTNNSTNATEAPPPDTGSGDLLSAELVFEQATTDPAGLARTVGWYPSVTAATDVNGNAYLDFLFRNPPNILPNPIAAEWLTTVKRTTGTGSLMTVAANLVNRSTGTNPTLATGQDTTSGDYATLAQPSVALLDPTQTGSADARLDTRPQVATGASGRISITVLREALSLRDLSPPALSAFQVSNTAFSPNFDGVKDTTTFSARVKDFSSVTWSWSVTDGTGAVVATSQPGSLPAGSDTTVSWIWDGYNTTTGLRVGDEAYRATLKATDGADKSATGPEAGQPPLEVRVDTVAPVISDYKVSSHTDPTTLVTTGRFSPNGDGYLDDAIFSASFSEQSSWTFTVRDDVLRVNTAGTGTSLSYSWNGAGVPDGPFTGTLTATDAAGNGATATTVVTRDTAPPSVPACPQSGCFDADPDVFNPTLPVTDPRRATHLSATLSDPWTAISWTMEVKDAAGAVVKSFVGTGGAGESFLAAAADWDGTDATGARVPNGVYTVVLSPKDAGRNAATDSLSVTLDTTPPLIGVIAPRDSGNTIYAEQPIVASVADRVLLDVDGMQQVADQQGSGVDPSSLSITVDDLTGPTLNQTLVSTLDGDVARSTPASLAVGSRYKVSVSATDRVGNSASAVATFLAVAPATATLPQVSIDSTPPDSVQAGATTDLSDLYVWEGAEVLVGSFTVSTTDSLHAGDGWVRVGFPASNVTITYTIGGLPGVPVHPTEQTAQALARFRIDQAGPASRTTAEQTAQATRLTALVPRAADAGSVRLAMAPGTADSALFPSCPDPTSEARCSPDPLPVNRHEDRWQPWANLMNADPYDLPALVADLESLTLPPNRCAGAPPSLADAVRHYGDAIGTPDSLAAGITFGPLVSEGLARIIECMALHVPLLHEVSSTPTDAERAEWLAAERDLLSAISTFPTDASFSTHEPSIDQQQLFQIGHNGHDDFSEDRVLIIDPGDTGAYPNDGDTYTNNAGGALIAPLCATRRVVRPLAVVLDLGGNELYNPSPRDCDSPTIGAGDRGAVGILVDLSGDDIYIGGRFSQGSGREGAGYLFDRTGADSYATPTLRTAFAMGVGVVGGFGFLVDGSLTDEDRYTVFGQQSMGFGGTGGVGLILGGAGKTSYSLQVPLCCFPTNTSGWGLGFGWDEGVGAVLDRGGPDNYRCVTRIVDSPSCIGSAGWSSVFLSGVGMGLALDAGPDTDIYVLDARAGMGASEGGLGVLANYAGDDQYFCTRQLCLGMSPAVLPDRPGDAVFQDIGLGTDRYCPDPSTERPFISTSTSSSGFGNGALWLGHGANPWAGVGFDDGGSRPPACP